MAASQIHTSSLYYRNGVESGLLPHGPSDLFTYMTRVRFKHQSLRYLFHQPEQIAHR